MDALLIPTLLCPKAWESMPGDVAVRFCSYCQKHVHNLEAMSVSERLTLLSSPAASICARYKIAIRRPAKGKEESYMSHMLKYGASVALTGSVLLVLWEMHEAENKRTWYRAVAGAPRTDPGRVIGCGWPEELYEEQKVVIMGITAPFPEPAKETHPGDPSAVPHHVDLQLDPVEIDKLLQPITPPTFERNMPVPLKTH